MLTGSELMGNGSPSSGLNCIMSPLCRSRKHVLKQAAQKSPGKLSAQYSHAENQGRRLISSAKTPQRERKEPAVSSSISLSFLACYGCTTKNIQQPCYFLTNQLQVTQNTSSARSFQKCIPRVPAGSSYPYEGLGRIWSNLFYFVFGVGWLITVRLTSCSILLLQA